MPSGVPTSEQSGTASGATRDTVKADKHHGGEHHMGGGMMAGMGLWMLLWPVLGLVLLGVVVAVGVWVVRRMPLPGGDATQILRRRYAAGEIDDEEYRRRTNALSR